MLSDTPFALHKSKLHCWEDLETLILYCDYAANMCNPDVCQHDSNDLAAQFEKVGSVCLRGKLLIEKLKINKYMQKVGKKLQGCAHDNFIKLYIKNM